MSATADLPSELEYYGVSDCEMVVRMRMPTNLHQKTMALSDGSVYQETILSQEAALKLYNDLHCALFGGEQPTNLKKVRIKKLT